MTQPRSQTVPDSIIEASAKRAAREAAQHHADFARSHESPWGALAIYLWAGFAFMASSLAGATFYAKGWTPQRPSALNAKVEPAPIIDRQQAGKVGVMVTASDGPLFDADAFAGSVDPLSTASTSGSDSLATGVLFGGFGPLDRVVPTYQAAQDNLSLDMREIDPLVRFKVVGNSHEAALVLGPFKTEAAAASFCKSARVACQATPYSGDPLFHD